MLEYVQSVFDYLTLINMHPLVTLTVVVVIALGRVKFEVPFINEAKQWHDDAAKAQPGVADKFMESAKLASKKADRISTYVFLSACVIAVIAQFAFYWPKSGQGRAICFVMSIVQVGVAEAVYVYADRWGIMDRIGKIVQKKVDAAGGIEEEKK